MIKNWCHAVATKTFGFGPITQLSATTNARQCWKATPKISKLLSGWKMILWRHAATIQLCASGQKMMAR